MIELEHRFLLENGYSLVDSITASELLFEHNGSLPSHYQVLEDEDARLYESKYRERVLWDGQETLNHNARQVYKPIDLNYFYDLIASDDLYSDHKNRLNKEIAFFKKHNLESFLQEVNTLIKQFKEQNVIWGVGRGSSCASYLLYLMGVHMIDPVRFDIPFSEFSKEYE